MTVQPCVGRVQQKILLLVVPWLPTLHTQVMQRTHLQSVPTHKHIYALQKYSNYVDFIIKTRSFFMKEFAKHQADFPGIDGESLFLGTVVHSTDHGNATHFCKPWDLVGKTAAYKSNSEIAGLVSSTFTDRLPLITLAYDMRFKHAKHPLFVKTYAVRFLLCHAQVPYYMHNHKHIAHMHMHSHARALATKPRMPENGARSGRFSHRPPPRRRDGVRDRPLECRYTVGSWSVVSAGEVLAHCSLSRASRLARGGGARGQSVASVAPRESDRPRACVPWYTFTVIRPYLINYYGSN